MTLTASGAGGGGGQGPGRPKMAKSPSINNIHSKHARSIPGPPGLPNNSLIHQVSLFTSSSCFIVLDGNVISSLLSSYTLHFCTCVFPAAKGSSLTPVWRLWACWAVGWTQSSLSPLMPLCTRPSFSLTLPTILRVECTLGGPFDVLRGDFLPKPCRGTLLG